MPHIWELVAKPGCPKLSKEPWVELIEVHPDLQSVPPREVPNPFSPRGAMMVSAPETTARLVVADESIATVFWALDESPILVLEFEDEDDEEEAISAMRDIAELMQAELRRVDY